ARAADGVLLARVDQSVLFERRHARLGITADAADLCRAVLLDELACGGHVVEALDRALVARRGERAPEAPVRQPLWALVVEHDGFLLDRAAVVGVQPRAHRLVVALLVGEERRRGLLLTAQLTG